MNKSIVCFTCKRDEPLLPIHYKQIRTVCDYPVYYLVDEQEIGGMHFPNGSIPMATDFNRNGNLIGKDALQGIIASFIAIGTDIIKIDSDTMLMSIDWIIDEAAMQGFSPASSFTIHGSCYYIQQETVRKIREFITSYYDDLNNNRCEDATITQLANLVSNPYQVLIQSPIKGSVINSCCFNRKMFNYPQTIHQVRNIINCGDRSYYEDYEIAGLDRTTQILRAMKFVLGNRERLV